MLPETRVPTARFYHDDDDNDDDDYYYYYYFFDLLGLSINWGIVLFSAPVADVTFLFFSSNKFNKDKLKLKFSLSKSKI